MNTLFGALSAAFVFLLSFYHVSGIGNYVLAQRMGILLWHFWAVGIVGCFFLAVFSGYTFRLPKNSIPYVTWSGSFILVCLLSLLIVNREPVAIDAITNYIWFFAVTVSLVFLVRTPALVRACGYGVVAAVIVMSVLTIMEFLDPNFQVIVDRFFEDTTQVGVVDRAGGLHMNANDNGTAIALGMLAGVLFVPVWLRFPFLLFAGVAIFGTVSRSSLTLWALATFACFYMGYIARGRIVGKILGSVLIGGLGFLLVSGQIPGLLVDAGMDDLLSTNMKERLSGNFFTQEDGSTQSRLEVAEAAMATFFDNPLVGIGLGESDSLDGGVGTHNQHLKIAAEMGIFGYLVFAALLVVALYSRSLAALFFVVLYFLVGLTNHSMLYATEYAVLLPLGVVLIPTLTKKTSVKKRRRRRRKTGSYAERQQSA